MVQVPRLLGERLDRPPGGHAGVVDQDVDPPVGPDDVVHDGRDAGRVAHVAEVRPARAPAPRALGGHPVQLFLAHVGHDGGDSLPGQGQRDLPADAAARPR